MSKMKKDNDKHTDTTLKWQFGTQVPYIQRHQYNIDNYSEMAPYLSHI